jgi:hypothetical protein
MTFQKTTLIIFSILFVIILAFFAYFIYKAQKKEYKPIQATCPDYWNLVFDTRLNKYVCRSQGNINLGTCNRQQQFPIDGLNTLCDKFKAITNPNNCGGTIMWDGVTNNSGNASC